jgi:hypothetical protein
VGGRREQDDEKEEDEEGKEEGEEDRDAALHGPRCMDPADPATQNFFSTSVK